MEMGVTFCQTSKWCEPVNFSFSLFLGLRVELCDCEHVGFIVVVGLFWLLALIWSQPRHPLGLIRVVVVVGLSHGTVTHSIPIPPPNTSPSPPVLHHYHPICYAVLLCYGHSNLSFLFGSSFMPFLELLVDSSPLEQVFGWDPFRTANEFQNITASILLAHTCSALELLLVALVPTANCHTMEWIFLFIFSSDFFN